MGSCASVQKGEEATMGYRMRLVTKAKRLFFSSPTKEKIQKENFNGEKDPKALAGFDSLPRSDSDFGSKEEIFFDSRTWLDSDCEDDFFSINGEFTPSRGNTPTHPKFTPKINDLSINEKLSDTKSEPSPRKKLSQLFVETSRTEVTSNESNADEKPKNEEPIKDLADDFAANSNEVNPFRERKKRERVLNYAGHCCFLGLTGTTGFDEGRQKASAAPCIAK